MLDANGIVPALNLNPRSCGCPGAHPSEVASHSVCSGARNSEAIDPILPADLERSLSAPGIGQPIPVKSNFHSSQIRTATGYE